MKQKEVLLIAITVFLTVVAWMLLDIYKVNTKFDINEGFESLKTIDYSLKSDLLKKLQEKNL